MSSEPRSSSRFRRLVGCVVRDVPLYLGKLVRGERAYLAIHNRAEQLERAPDRSGYRLVAPWTSPLHAPGVLRGLGRSLLARALADHPIDLSQDQPAPSGTEPAVTFLIGHRGSSRLVQLFATLRSIAGQHDCAVECIVIEQDVTSQLEGRLPGWVRLVHTPPPAADMPYCRSWAFNVGARHARAPVLVLHDNDMLAPAGYAAGIVARVREGYEVVNLKRFVFYMTMGQSQSIAARGATALHGMAPESVVQNLEAGGSIAITRDAFERIGGMDESFIGWGGEDNEFWERAKTQRTWPWGTLSLVHLWHASQPGKHEAGNPTAARLRALAEIPPVERIARLHAVPRGDTSGPSGTAT
jgi:hypothetical protein